VAERNGNEHEHG